MKNAQETIVEVFWHENKNLNEINGLNAGNKCRGFGNKCRRNDHWSCTIHLANIMPELNNQQKRSMVHSTTDC